MQDIRTKYQAHVSAMLKLAGFTDTDARAERIVHLEHAIAEKHLSLADNDDIHKANNTWTQADFATKAPGLDWTEYFHGAGLSKQASFIVWQPTAFAGESALVASDSARHLERLARVSPDRGVCSRAAQGSRRRALRLLRQDAPRYAGAASSLAARCSDRQSAAGRRCRTNLRAAYFSPQAKAQAQAMVANIIAAFRKRIEALSWMDPSTKAEAQAKLTTLYVGIGYPGNLDRLLGLRSEAGRHLRQHLARRPVRVSPRRRRGWARRSTARNGR